MLRVKHFVCVCVCVVLQDIGWVFFACGVARLFSIFYVKYILNTTWCVF